MLQSIEGGKREEQLERLVPHPERMRGAFAVERKRIRDEIISGEISEASKLFEISTSILKANHGELIKIFCERNNQLVEEVVDHLITWMSLEIKDGGSMAICRSRYPRVLETFPIASFSRFLGEKRLIQMITSSYEDALCTISSVTHPEDFGLFREQSFKRFEAKGELYRLVYYTLMAHDDQKILERIPQGLIKELCESNLADRNLFERKDIEKLIEILGDIPSYFAVTENFLYVYAHTGSQKLLQLVPDSVREECRKNPNILSKYLSHFPKEYTFLTKEWGIEPVPLARKEEKPYPKEWFWKVDEDALVSLLEVALGEKLDHKELSSLRTAYESLYQDYCETLENPGRTTYGGEVELFNSESEEFRIPIVDYAHRKTLIKFLVSLVAFITDRIKSKQDTRFREIPHSNFHLNIGLTPERYRVARRYQKTLTDICYVFALASESLARIERLEKSKRTVSIDMDITPVHPSTVARFQDRFPSLPGTRIELKRSLGGVLRKMDLIPALLDQPEKLQKAQNILRNDKEIQNLALEIKWLAEESMRIPGVYNREDEEPSTIALDDAQKNLDIRYYFLEVQDRLRERLDKCFDEL